MDIVQVDGRLSRTILAAMVTDPVVLAEIAGYWPKEGLFGHKYQNLVAGWCVRYFGQHSQAPGHVVQALYDEWEAANADSEDVPFLKRMLQYLSDDYRPVPASYAIEMAGRFFNQQLAQTKLDEATALLQANRTEEAWGVIEGLRQISTGTNSSTALGDADGFSEAFDYAMTPDLISWPDELEALQMFFAGQTGRGCFLSLMAGEKVGKSWWLNELAWQAARCGNRVAMFSVGDMSAKQIRRRMIPRICGRPIEPKVVQVPRYLAPGGVIDEDSVTHERIEYVDYLERAVFEEKFQRWHRSPYSTNVQLFIAPMATMTAEGVRLRATRLLHGGWPPDVIVVDYADILAPMNGQDDTRAQTNRTWQELRRISQELDCLVITATQADAASYTTNTLTRSNFSEDKRKLAHVTGMVGINQTQLEKELQVCRLNWILGREIEIVRPVHVAGCLSLGRVATMATY